jgi:DNA invertase Pin-like site-specific DNA recombinase
VLDRSYIDLSTPIGRGFMAMFSAMAEDERGRIIKRTHEGRKISQARGVKMGRKGKAERVAEGRSPQASSRWRNTRGSGACVYRKPYPS